MTMSQEEIFRKYMSESAQAKKKAKNLRSAGNMRIVENEVSLKQIPYGERSDKEYGEDAPQFVAPMAPAGKSKWKTGFTTVGFTPVGDGITKGSDDTARRRHDSDSDESPVRAKEKSSSSSSNSDESPPRKRTFTEAPRKFSETPRSSSKKKKKKKKRKKDSSESESSSESDSDESPERKAGIQTANKLREKLAKMKEFAEKKKREQEGEFKVGEAPVRRDAHGSKIDMILEQAKESAENEEERKKLEKFMLYSKGIVQHKENMAKKADNELEMTKPVARYADDKDYNDLMKNKSRLDDPMNSFMEKKKKKKKKKKKSKKSKKKKKKQSSSDSDSDSSSNSESSYKGPPAPPNRFGIAPGPKWDGVDRSNGYEKLLFMKQAEKLAMKQEQYKYSTAFDL